MNIHLIVKYTVEFQGEDYQYVWAESLQQAEEIAKTIYFKSAILNVYQT